MENFMERCENYARICRENTSIPLELYDTYQVKKGLRDKNGEGVRAGLTNISRIDSFEVVDGQKVPCDGKLYYRGIDIEDLVRGFTSENRFGFEETAYLLLFGSSRTGNSSGSSPVPSPPAGPSPATSPATSS